MTKPKTVRVRIPVAVQSDGDWYAYGWNTCDSAMKEEEVLELADRTAVVHWVEAELPVPVNETVVDSRTKVLDLVRELQAAKEAVLQAGEDELESARGRYRDITNRLSVAEW